MSRSRNALLLGSIAAPFVLLLVATGHDGVAFELRSLVFRIALWGAVLLTSAEIGAWLTGSRLTGPSHLTWDGGAGLAVFIAVIIAVARIPGGFRPRVVVGLVVLLSLMAIALRRWRRSRAVGGAAPDEATWPAGVGAVLVVVASVGLIWNRVPAVFFDSLVYHFAHPFHWLVKGQASPESWALHSWFPPGVSMLYGVGLAALGDTSANDANLLAALLLVAAVADLSRRIWGPAAAVAAAGLLVTIPLFLHALTIPAADLLHGMFAFGAVACFLLARRDRSPAWFRRASLFAAGAVLTKYLGFLVPVVLVAALFALWPSREGQGSIAARACRSVLFVLPAVVLVAPWLYANSQVTGSPLAPLLVEDRSAALADSGGDAFRGAARGGLPRRQDFAALLPRLVTGDSEESRIYPTPAWGWALPVLVAVTLLWASSDRDIRFVLWLAGICSGVWLMSFRWERFLLTTTALLVVACGAAMPLIWRRGRLARALLGTVAVVALLTVIRSGYEIHRFTGGTAIAIGRERAGDYLDRARPIELVYLRAAQRLDRERDRILLLGPTRHHRLAIPHVAPTVYNRHPWVEAVSSTRTPAQCSRRLVAEGYTHLLVDPAQARAGAAHPSLAFLRDRPQLVSTYIRSLGRPIVSHRGIALFALPTTVHSSVADPAQPADD